jgi:hypothetical protein
MLQLVEHHRRPTHRQPQRELVHREGEARRAVAAEQTLAGQPGGHPILHLLLRHIARAAEHRAGVVTGLQQAGHARFLKLADRDRLGLVIDQGDELLGQPGAVLLKPARNVLLAAEREQSVALGARHSAHGQEPRHLHRGDVALAGQQSRYSARRQVKPLRGFPAGEPGPLHRPAQPIAQLSAADCWFVIVYDDLPLRTLNPPADRYRYHAA